MQVKVLVSLSGGLVEDNSSSVLASEGASLPSVKLVNVRISDDEFLFDQGYTEAEAALQLDTCPIKVTCFSPSLGSKPLALTLCEATVSCYSPTVITSVLILNTCQVEAEAFSPTCGGVLGLPTAYVTATAFSPSVTFSTSLQPAYNLVWLLTAGD